MTENKKPAAATIKILKGISKNFDIEMADIKPKFTKLLESRAIQNLDVPDRSRTPRRPNLDGGNDGRKRSQRVLRQSRPRHYTDRKQRRNIGL